MILGTTLIACNSCVINLNAYGIFTYAKTVDEIVTRYNMIKKIEAEFSLE